MESKQENSTTVDIERAVVVDDGEIRRDLQERHIQMISIAGMIGTGLFLSSGQAIAKAGPVGALLGYIVMGIITAGVSYTAGEISSFSPTTGGFIRHATRFVEPALGAAAGYNFWYTMSISVSAEISAAATLVQYWNTAVNPAVWITVFLIVILGVNFCGVRMYGETEVVFATFKILLILGLIIAGLVVDLGGGPDHDRRGFRYWKSPGAFNVYLADGATGHFLAFWSTLVTAAFSYGNIQVVAIAGAETQRPRHNIPKATRRTFFRVAFFYIGSIFIVGLLVPYTERRLSQSTGTAAQSPFVIAFEQAGVKVLPSIINAVVCTSAISSGSSCVFIATRTLYGLSRDGHAPRFFQRCNRFGTPFYAVGLTSLLTPLVYLNVRTASSVVFGWFVNITTIAGLIGWVVVQSSYLRFFYAMKAQGRSRDELAWKGPLQPYVAWATLFAVVVVILFSGYDIFFPGNYSAASFVTCYINLPIFAALYIFFKIYLKSKIIHTGCIDLEPELTEIEREKAAAALDERRPQGLFNRVMDKVF